MTHRHDVVEFAEQGLDRHVLHDDVLPQLRGTDPVRVTVVHKLHSHLLLVHLKQTFNGRLNLVIGAPIMLP